MVPPTQPVEVEVPLDLGGTGAQLPVIGSGHTGRDLVVVLPALGALPAGDLVEESGPPALEDPYHLGWPQAPGWILALGTQRVIPGHRREVGREFAARQREQLDPLANWWLGEQVMGARVREYLPPFTAAALRSALDPARLEVSAGPSSPAGAP